MHGVEFSYIEGNKSNTDWEFQAAPRAVALVGRPAREKNDDFA